MKPNWLLPVAVLGGLAIALLAVMMLRFEPAGGAGNQEGVYILDRLTGDVCVAGFSQGKPVSVCIPMGRVMAR